MGEWILNELGGHIDTVLRTADKLASFEQQLAEESLGGLPQTVTPTLADLSGNALSVGSGGRLEADRGPVLRNVGIVTAILETDSSFWGE